MKENIGSKTLAVFIVLTILLSTVAVLYTMNIGTMQTAGATMGVDEWQNSSTGAEILNMSTEDIYYGNTVTVKFNGSLINDTCYVYKPSYNKTWNDGVGDYVYSVDWTKLSGSSLSPTHAEPQTEIMFDRAGLWLVVEDNAPYLDKFNMSNMSYYDVSEGSWEDIVGWFWVNATDWTIELSDRTVKYGHNDSVTITVKQGGNPISRPCWIDIWLLNESSSELVYHKELEAADEGVWTITGSFMYTLTHSNGAGIYQITAYDDAVYGESGYAKHEMEVYEDEGSGGVTPEKGYNDTFGNTSIWTKFDGRILNSSGNVLNGNWNDTTYRYDTCGPFDPPEFWATPVNLTVAAGEPQLSIPERNATMYWSFPGEVNVSIKDYDGNDITTPYTVIVLNRAKENVTANITLDKQNGYCRIISDSWGINGSHIWGTNGTWYIRIVKSDVGNASEEWNGTVKFKVTRAPGVQIKLIDDGDGNNDGELSEVPHVDNQPLTIKFQVINRKHGYLGAGDQTEDMKNITLSGNALLLSSETTLYEYNEMIPGSVQFTGGKTWEVNITPTMAPNGGELTISVNWGNWGTDEETIMIGGSLLNGTVVSISPEEFVIGENITLTVRVTTPTGMPGYNAYVALYYINNSGGLQHLINWTNGGGTSTGEFYFFFNVSQQTDNQTNVWPTIEAPRYIAAYADLNNVGYGYGYAKMKPKSDLGVKLSKDTLMAGEATDFWINVSIVDENCNSTGTPDDTNLHVRIYNETGDDVTDSIGSITTSQLDGDATIELTGEYITEPGIYTIYAYNNTHNSEGCNATLTVVPVDVTCDISEFIWNVDDNISATFTVTWQGQPVGNGTLRIFNITDTGTYNKTWVNYTAGNATIDVEVTNGVVTIHNITANYLPPEVGLMNITFAYRPENAGDYANATGVIPVKVADVTPTPDMVALNEPATVNILVSGRGEPLEGVFVSIDGPGNIQLNTSSGSDGIATFSFVPTVTGEIEILVENRTTGVKIEITAHTLNIDAPAQVNEDEEFTVTVKDENDNPVEGAQVKFTGTGETKTTDENGEVKFIGTVPGTLPYATYKLIATKAGYRGDEETIIVANLFQLYIDAPAEVDAGSTFNVKVTSDAGVVYGVDVTFNDVTKTITGLDGVTFTAPTKVDKKTPYDITASKEGYKTATATVTVKPAGIPGFELITLIAATGVAFILLRKRRH